GQKRGRPVKPPKEGRRNQVGLSLTAATKRRLDVAAARDGRTLADEVERRLLLTLDREDLLVDVTRLAYGPQAAGLLRLFGYMLDMAWTDVPSFDLFGRDMYDVSNANWLESCGYYAIASIAITTVLDELRSSGERDRSIVAERGFWDGAEEIGKELSALVLHHLADTDTPFWSAIRADLGRRVPSTKEDKK